MEDYVQIAGICDEDEAHMLIKAGADAIGFPLRLDVNQEDITEKKAVEIIRSLKDSVEAVLITYLDKAEEVVTLCDTLGVVWVQLHGEIAITELAKLKKIAPHLSIIKSLIVRGDNERALQYAIEKYSPHVDAYITDTYDPTTGATGATGKIHDWDVSRWIVEMSPKPVILAGGLNPKNVRDAIFHVRPAGVDTHTGVKGRDGRRDPKLVRSFVTEARTAFASVRNNLRVK